MMAIELSIKHFESLFVDRLNVVQQAWATLVKHYVKWGSIIVLKYSFATSIVKQFCMNQKLAIFNLVIQVTFFTCFIKEMLESSIMPSYLYMTLYSVWWFIYMTFYSVGWFIHMTFYSAGGFRLPPLIWEGHADMSGLTVVQSNVLSCPVWTASGSPGGKQLSVVSHFQRSCVSRPACENIDLPPLPV